MPYLRLILFAFAISELLSLMPLSLIYFLSFFHFSFRCHYAFISIIAADFLRDAAVDDIDADTMPLLRRYFHYAAALAVATLRFFIFATCRVISIAPFIVSPAYAALIHGSRLMMLMILCLFRLMAAADYALFRCLPMMPCCHCLLMPVAAASHAFLAECSPSLRHFCYY